MRGSDQREIVHSQHPLRAFLGGGDDLALIGYGETTDGDRMIAGGPGTDRVNLTTYVETTGSPTTPTSTSTSVPAPSTPTTGPPRGSPT